MSSNKTRENTGRWSKAEHDVFIQGLRTHGKEWKVIAQMVETRTVVQIRTHAQKYFQKLSKLGITDPIADIRAGHIPPFNSSKRPRDDSSRPPAKSTTNGPQAPRPMIRVPRVNRPRSDSAPVPRHHTGSSRSKTAAAATVSGAAPPRPQSRRRAAPAIPPRRATAGTTPSPLRRQAAAHQLHTARRAAASSSAPPQRYRVPSTKEDAARGAVLSEWSKTADSAHKLFDHVRPTATRLARSMSVDDDALMGRMMPSVPVVELMAAEHPTASTAFAALPRMSSYADFAAEDYSIDTSYPTHTKAPAIGADGLVPFGDASPTGVTDAFFFPSAGSTSSSSSAASSTVMKTARDDGRISPVPHIHAADWAAASTNPTVADARHPPVHTRITKRQRTSYHIRHPASVPSTGMDTDIDDLLFTDLLA